MNAIASKPTNKLLDYSLFRKEKTIMSKISIANLQADGSALLTDSESFLSDLSAEELNISGGGYKGCGKSKGKGKGSRSGGGCYYGCH
jgi:hypothetical protein